MPAPRPDPNAILVRTSPDTYALVTVRTLTVRDLPPDSEVEDAPATYLETVDALRSVLAGEGVRYNSRDQVR